MRFIFLFIMLFLHIVDDYYLQGILASMKQKKWWYENAPAPLYKNDWKMALFEHAFSWSFMITLPWLVVSIATQNNMGFFLLTFFYILNTILHACIDNLKANEEVFNLIIDQSLHFLQICTTWLAFIIIGV